MNSPSAVISETKWNSIHKKKDKKKNGKLKTLFILVSDIN